MKRRPITLAATLLPESVNKTLAKIRNLENTIIFILILLVLTKVLPSDNRVLIGYISITLILKGYFILKHMKISKELMIVRSVNAMKSKAKGELTEITSNAIGKAKKTTNIICIFMYYSVIQLILVMLISSFSIQLILYIGICMMGCAIIAYFILKLLAFEAFMKYERYFWEIIGTD